MPRLGVRGGVDAFGALVFGDDLADGPLDLALRPALADELLDQNQILLTHAFTVAAAAMTTRHRSGNQVVNG